MNVDSLRAFSILRTNVYKKKPSHQGLYKYDQETYDLLMDSFDLFPLACVVNNKFLAIHGGISPDLKTVTRFCISDFSLKTSKKLIDTMNHLGVDCFVIYYGVIQ